jgi:hypothetical protein
MKKSNTDIQESSISLNLQRISYNTNQKERKNHLFCTKEL